mmetsp:Transcript_13817/g.48799  ORF Transcript_13817/g.48799 Transcript_13817/m.48799 type:complete len:501 (+) Transcript_13817:67-1569(+)
MLQWPSSAVAIPMRALAPSNGWASIAAAAACSPAAPLHPASASVVGRQAATSAAFSLSSSAFSAAVLAVAIGSSRAGRRAAVRKARTRLFYKRLDLPKKKRSSFGPKTLNGVVRGLNTVDEKELDIYEWINKEDVLDEPRTAIEDFKEIAAYTVAPGIGAYRYDAPEYRPPPPKTVLAKAPKLPPSLDEYIGIDDEDDVVFSDTVLKAVEEFGDGASVLEDADFVLSWSTLRTLLAYADGSLIEDFIAKGWHTKRGTLAEMIDLFRISRMSKEAPNAVLLGSVATWDPAHSGPIYNPRKYRSYDVSLQNICTGQADVSAPVQVKQTNADGPQHVRLLKYRLGDLKVVLEVPVKATLPTQDLEDMKGVGHSVDIRSANIRDASEIWGWTLSSHMAMMKLTDTAMTVRAIVDSGFITEVQELTLEDLRLDRPEAFKEADQLVGRIAGLLVRIRDVADCPGCIDKPLWVQYYDGYLRVVSPREFYQGQEVAEEVDEVMYFGAP